MKHGGISFFKKVSQKFEFYLHPRDQNNPSPNNFPKYGFMLFQQDEAMWYFQQSKKKYEKIDSQTSQFQDLLDLWSTAVFEVPPTVTANATNYLINPYYEESLAKLKEDFLSMNDWKDGCIQLIQDLQRQVLNNTEAIATTQQQVVNIQLQLPTMTQQLNQQGQQQTIHQQRIQRIEEKVTRLTNRSQYTYIPPPYFQSRDSITRQLEQFTSTYPVGISILAGSGGNGKSKVSQMFANSQKIHGKYKFIRVMDMSASFIEGSLLDLCELLDVPTFEKSKGEWSKELSIRIAQQSWLLIWDNVDTCVSIAEHVNLFFPGLDINATDSPRMQHVIITTRDITDWDLLPIGLTEHIDSTLIEVDVYTEEEAMMYMKHQIRAASYQWYHEESAKKLASVLGYQPLALELALADICLFSRTIADFLHDLEEAGLKPLSGTASERGTTIHFQPISEHTIFSLWKIGLEKLSPDSIKILRVLAFGAGNGMCKDALKGAFSNVRDEEEHGDDGQRYQNAILELRQQSLIQASLQSIGSNNTTKKYAEKWKMHRLLQKVVRNDALLSWSLLDSYNDENSEQDPSPFTSNLLEAFLDVLKCIWDAVYDPRRRVVTDKSLISEGVKNAHEWIINIRHSTFIQQDADTSIIEWDVMLLLDVANVESEFLRHYQNGIADFEYVSRTIMSRMKDKKYHNKLIGAHLGHAAALMAMEDYKSSKEIAEFVLNLLISLHRDGTENNQPIPDFVAIHINTAHLLMASILMKTSSYDLAEKIMANLATFHDRAFINSPSMDLATVYGVKGMIALGQANYETAIRFTSASLEVMNDLRKRGEYVDLDAIASKYENLGVMLAHDGNVELALDCYDKAMEYFREKYRDEDSYEIALLLNNQGKLCINTNLVLAKDYCQQALDMLTKLHLDCVTKANVLGNLARIHFYQSQHNIAIDCGMKAWKLMQQIYHESSPKDELSINILSTLASAAREQGDFISARQFSLTSLNIAQYLHGKENHNNSSKIHRHIGYCYKSLGMIEFRAKNYQAAKEYYDKARGVFIAWHGLFVPHADMIDILINYAVLYYEENQFKNAKEHFLSALQQMKILEYPQHHRDMQTVMNGLTAIHQKENDQEKEKKKNEKVTTKEKPEDKGKSTSCCRSLIGFVCCPCLWICSCFGCCKENPGDAKDTEPALTERLLDDSNDESEDEYGDIEDILANLRNPLRAMEQDFARAFAKLDAEQKLKEAESKK